MRRARSRSHHAATRRGFTLLEVLMAMGIFFLLAGGIFAVVSATNRVTNDVVQVQLETKRFDAFQRFLRTFFTNLPAGATLDLRVRNWPGGLGSGVELLISPAPPILPTVDGADDNLGVAIGGVPDGAGFLRVSLARFSTEEGEAERDRQLDQAEWVPLIGDIRRIRWRFAAPNDTAMSETWDAALGRPGLAELSVESSDGTVTVLAFWIPQVFDAPPGELN